MFNFPTKRHWKNPSKIEGIKSGLTSLVAEVQRLNITSTAIPLLGYGNGGLLYLNHPAPYKKYNKSIKIMHLQEASSENTPQARLIELAKISVELARVVAKNPNAAPELLKKLGDSEDKQTRQNVAKNPNSPTNLLFRLGVEFPQELLDNPILSLLLLENPNLIKEMPVETLVKLLELDTIPTDWMVMAANRNSKKDYPVLETLVKSLRTPASVLSKLLKIDDSANKIGDTIALSAQMHVNYAGEITEGWEEAAKNSISECTLYCHRDSVFELWKIGAIPEYLLGALSSQVELEIADDLTTPARTLENLAKNTYIDSILAKLAGNPNTPLSTIEKLATNYNQVEFTAFIYNPNISLSLLQKYCQQKATAKFTNLIKLQKNRNLKNNNQQVHTLELKFLDAENRERYDIACNPNTSIDILKKLAQDQIWLIRKAVALNPNTPIEILDKLAEDSSSQVKDAVLKTCQNIFEKSDFLDSIFTKLINTKDGSVIWQIVYHPCTPDNVLEKLAQDNRYYSWIICHPNAPLKLLLKCIYDGNSKLKKDALELFWKKLLLNPEIINDAMQILKDSYLNKYDIKIALARYPNTSVETLNDLAKDSDIRIRALVAKHPNASIEILTNLLEDKDNHVRLATINNYQQNTDKYSINSENFIDKWEALKNLDISETQLGKLAKHQNIIIREAVALHPKTPVDILAKLATDKHVAVRIGAVQNPNTPVDIIEKLAQTKTKSFQAAKTAAIKVLVNNYPEKASSYLQTYVNTPTPSLARLIGLLHIGASSDFLANNSDSPSYLERYAVAQHPNTPHDVLRKLKNDPNRIVRAAAKAEIIKFDAK